MDRRVLLTLALSLARLASIGLVAIGFGGLLAGAFGVAFGKDFVSGDPPGVSYTPDRCADFLEYYPSEPTCEAAATAHHFDEVISYRLAAGVLGLLGLAALAILRRYRSALVEGEMLPPVLNPTAGATAFGLASVGLLGLAASQTAFGSASGAGALLSGGLISLVATAICARSPLLALSQVAPGV